MEKNPAGVFGKIGRDAQFGAVLHDAAANVECFGVNEPAFVVSRLRPWVRKQDENSADRRVRQRIQQRARIVDQDANVAKGALRHDAK